MWKYIQSCSNPQMEQRAYDSPWQRVYDSSCKDSQGKPSPQKALIQDHPQWCHCTRRKYKTPHSIAIVAGKYCQFMYKCFGQYNLCCSFTSQVELVCRHLYTCIHVIGRQTNHPCQSRESPIKLDFYWDWITPSRWTYFQPFPDKHKETMTLITALVVRLLEFTIRHTWYTCNWLADGYFISESYNLTTRNYPLEKQRQISLL